EEPRSFAQHLRGELDWITMKALEKDRVRRYGAASELAADISRYLRNEPVVAGPATATYRMKKYALRHRIALGAAAGLVLLLAGFAVVQAVELHRIKEERNRADRERDRATHVTDFMTNMFKVSDPTEARGNSITAREILDKASAEIGTSLTKDPELQAQMMHVMGDVYENLGLYPRAQSLQQQSMEIRQRVLGPEHPDTLNSMNSLANTLFREGHYVEAEKMYRETLDIRRRVLGPEHPDTLKSMNNLANVLNDEGHSAEAEKLDRETLDIQRRVLGPEHPDTLKSMNNLANALAAEGHTAEAEKLDRETLDIKRRVLGPEHPDTLTSMDGLAAVLTDEGHTAEAEKLDRETLDIKRRVLGPEHPETAVSTYNLGCVAAHRGQSDQALSLLREAVDHGLPPFADLGIDKDPDLKSLHGDPRFDALVAHAKERAAATKKPN
ncbi:MAG: tetratricopeptide repeat protein, partial [Candidatus Acidiferrales bacterium]